MEVHLRLTSLSALAALLACSAGAVAQETSGPPPVLMVTREQFKPGNMAEHNKQIPAFYALFERAKVGTYRLGLLPVSGDLNHLVYLEGYPSFAEMEATDRKLEDVMAASPALRAEMEALTLKNDRLHESQTAWVARLRPDLSYRPNTREMTGKARYFTVTALRVNAGRGSDLADYVKQTNAAREKASLDDHVSVYQVTSGAPGGTYLILSTSRSLVEADEAVKGMDARDKKMEDALGGAVVVKQRQKALADILAQSTTTLYRIDRALSRPRPEFVAADPDFWKVKEPVKKEPARK
jgi:hypothetical protein